MADSFTVLVNDPPDGEDSFETEVDDAPPCSG